MQIREAIPLRSNASDGNYRGLRENSQSWIDNTFYGHSVGFPLSATCRVNAQVISGDLVGTILDKTGAVVPASGSEATKIDTGVKV